jgi:NADPH-dependent curcumin reductase CurA
MNTNGRISVSGQIAVYNDHSPDTGPRPFSLVLLKQLRVEAFIVFRRLSRWPEGRVTE